MAKNDLIDVIDILNEYSDDIQEGIMVEAEKIAKQASNEVKTGSPKGKRKKYSKGWRVKTVKGKGWISSTVYNATDHQLTHLLEYGHSLKRNGQTIGSAKAKPHIKSVEEKYIKEYEKQVERIIKNGG